jgi:hypothetical protein
MADFNERLRRAPNMPPRAAACGDPPGYQEQAKIIRFRPLLLAIWYPASGPSSRMQLRDYTDLPLIPGFSDFAVRLKQFGETTAKRAVLPKKRVQ